MLSRYNITDDKEANAFVGWEETYLKLWATHFCYLNDSKELISGLESFLSKLEEFRANRVVAKNKYDSIRNDINDLISSARDKSCVRKMAYYPLSFCEDGNLLSQWKWYGKQGGVAIEYDLKNCRFLGNKMYKNKIPSEGIIYDILYKPDDQKEIYGKYIDARHRFWKSDKILDNVAEEVCLLSLFMKDQSFMEEAESRLLFVVTIPNSPKDLMPLLRFRKKGSDIVPYIEARVYKNSGIQTPVRSITIGPGENQSLVFEAFYQFVLCNFPPLDQGSEGNKSMVDGCDCIRVHGIDLRRSTTPFRS